MFWIILKKEVAELCTSVWLRVWLIVSCLLVTTALSGGHTRYVEKHQEFLDAATRVNTSVQEYDATRPEEDTFKILRQPSVLSSVVYGLEGGIPIYMAITPNGVRPGAAPSANETVLGLFGDFDFLFLTEVVFGLMTALLAANLVSTERERGTLKLLLSHAVPRSTFLLGKAVGGYSVAASIFIVSTLVGVLYVLTDGFPIFQPETALRFSVIAYFGEKGHLFRFQSGHPSERSDAGWFRMG